MIGFAPIFLVSLTIASLCATSLHAEDFNTNSILPIVPEISTSDHGTKQPSSPSSTPSLNHRPITLPSAPEEDAPPLALEAIPFPTAPQQTPEKLVSQPAVPEGLPTETVVAQPPSPTPSIEMPVVPVISTPSSSSPESSSTAAIPQPPSHPTESLQESPLPPNTTEPVTNPVDMKAPESEEQPASPVATEESVDEPAASEPSMSSTTEQTATLTPSQKIELPTQSQTATESTQISLGDFGMSLMFSPEDINTLSQILQAYEIRKSSHVAEDLPEGSEADLLAELLRAANGDEPLPEDTTEVEEDTMLPAFYLGSIVFNHKGDWALWVNQQRATPKKRTLEELGITVRGVSKEFATLAWKPEDMASAKEHWAAAKKIDPSAPREWKHREVRGARIDFDEEKGEFVVTMRANQTFYADSMQIFEGRRTIPVSTVAGEAAPTNPGVVDQTLGLFAPEAAAPNNAPPTPADALQPIPQTNAGGVGKEREAVNKLINNLKTATGAISGIAGGGTQTNATTNPPNAPAAPAQ